MIFRRKPALVTDHGIAQEREDRLVAAEKRANALFQKAEWLHTAVTRRDQQNHWQAAVNELFLGGQP